ncbi:type IV secretory system conjugative DNA transfer family protein [Cardinium endosymbiont of Dermatophagoides farinae]|nr:type IV secretory system conjugative DNA transfer family protein [Cardinium endosymbiont of Dermatophagoides farinae]
MLTFYFFLVLFLFQLLYWMKISRICINDRYLKWAVDLVFYSGFGCYTRLILVGSICFLAWDRLKLFLSKSFSKNNGFTYTVLLFLWLIFTCCFISFERICIYLSRYDFIKSREWLIPYLFILFFTAFALPFWFYRGIKPSIKKDKNLIISPLFYDKNSHFSIALPTKNGLLPINNPQRGIYILGGPGSGKTRYILEPILYEMIRKGYCGLVYDYDFEGTPVDPKKSYCLSKFIYNCYLKLPERSKKNISFKTINFMDLNKSSRINPIDPIYISDRAYLEEYVTVLLKNLNPGGKDDFWYLSTKSLLKGIIAYLSNQAKSCCTLPHVLTLSTKPFGKILSLIEQDSEAYSYASSIFDAYKGGDKSSGQLIGIIASFKTSLQPLIDKNLFWVLSKNEIKLNINDNVAPTILCIGNFPPAKSAFSPVISLLITICFKSMYGHNRTKSFVAIDELPTLYIPGLSEVPATARKYGISTISYIQSNAQLEDTYGSIGAKKIQSTLSNQFMGNCGVESSRYASSIFGKEEHTIKSTSSSETCHSNTQGHHTTHGENITIHEQELIKPNEFASFDVGFFAGKVVESDSVFFQEQFKNVSSYDKNFKNELLKDLPDVTKVSNEDIAANQRKIEKEIDLLLEYM